MSTSVSSPNEMTSPTDAIESSRAQAADATPQPASRYTIASASTLAGPVAPIGTSASEPVACGPVMPVHPDSGVSPAGAKGQDTPDTIGEPPVGCATLAPQPCDVVTAGPAGILAALEGATARIEHGASAPTVSQQVLPGTTGGEEYAQQGEHGETAPGGASGITCGANATTDGTTQSPIGGTDESKLTASPLPGDTVAADGGASAPDDSGAGLDQEPSWDEELSAGEPDATDDDDDDGSDYFHEPVGYEPDEDDGAEADTAGDDDDGSDSYREPVGYEPDDDDGAEADTAGDDDDGSDSYREPVTHKPDDDGEPDLASRIAAAEQAESARDHAPATSGVSNGSGWRPMGFQGFFNGGFGVGSSIRRYCDEGPREEGQETVAEAEVKFLKRLTQDCTTRESRNEHEVQLMTFAQSEAERDFCGTATRDIIRCGHGLTEVEAKTIAEGVLLAEQRRAHENGHTFDPSMLSMGKFRKFTPFNHLASRPNRLFTLALYLDFAEAYCRVHKVYPLMADDSYRRTPGMQALRKLMGLDQWPEYRDWGLRVIGRDVSFAAMLAPPKKCNMITMLNGVRMFSCYREQFLAQREDWLKDPKRQPPMITPYTSTLEQLKGKVLSYQRKPPRFVRRECHARTVPPQYSSIP